MTDELGSARRSTRTFVRKLTLKLFKALRRAFVALKLGLKPIAPSTGKPDQRRRDNKTTPGNTQSLKPGKSSDPKNSK